MTLSYTVWSVWASQVENYMAPNSNPNMPRPDRKETVLLLWRDFSMEMVQLDMLDVHAKVAGLN